MSTLCILSVLIIAVIAVNPCAGKADTVTVPMAGLVPTLLAVMV